MAKAFQHAVISANDLFDGRVIYLDAAGQWVDRLAEAELIKDEARAEQRLALALAQSERAVGPYLAPARAGENGPEPAHFREAFRATGPSNYFHGKQTEAV
ncbi:MAG: DUF2849 domain-containing protein [Paracoccus sp. (in: a-proteobacteria)]|nr:DUF2849 domain-containing protein [Paracoccus sp. (in: a-proteobacteria)]